MKKYKIAVAAVDGIFPQVLSDGIKVLTPDMGGKFTTSQVDDKPVRLL